MILHKNDQKPSEKEINLILELFSKKKLVEAKKQIEKDLIKYPNSAILFNILGAVYAELNEPKEALKNYKKAIDADSNYSQAYNNLGITFHRLENIDKAIDNYKKAINLKKDFAEALNNLGSAKRDINKPHEALEYLNKAINLKSNYAEAYNNLALVYYDIGNKEEALENFRKAIKIKPDYAEAHHHLGTVLSDLTSFDESLSSYKKSIECNPNIEKVYNNLGNLYNNLGKYDEATEAYKKAIEIKPDYARAHSNLLLNISYKKNFDHQEYLKEAKNFRISCEPKKNFSFKYNFEKNPTKLKLGLVSADFGNHPGGFFTLSTLRELKKKNFELIAYSTNDRKDEYSNNFKSLFLKWHSIEKEKDEKIIETILKDGIHILIDLQGHSAKNRLPIFIYKAAPIQLSWLGQGSTGIPEIDYFIGGPHVTPKDEDNHYIEKIFRLPEISMCFTPPDFDVEINTLPALKNNFITFGCINKLTKVNNDVILLWSKVLSLVKDSKIFLKNKDLEDKGVFSKTLEKFRENNINEDRIILEGGSKSRKELLKAYNRIDISLDPFPFQGNTSTVESVWMGVPVITLKGNRYLFHFGESINSNLNMNNWIANNHEEYISKSLEFASDIKQLSKIRKTLRQIAIKSPVFDAIRFSEHFSDMLWDIWDNFKKKK
jgi:protein O-GlcNAc transferase